MFAIELAACITIQLMSRQKKPTSLLALRNTLLTSRKNSSGLIQWKLWLLFERNNSEFAAPPTIR